MRKISIIAVTIFIVVFSFVLSCRKSDQKPQPVNAAQNKEIVDQINQFFKTKESATTKERADKMENVRASLDFSTLRIEDFTADKKIVLVNIKSSFRSVNNLSKNPSNTLYLTLDQKGIANARIVQYIPNQSNLSNALPANTLPKMFFSKPVDIDGSLAFLSIADEINYEMDFNAGKFVSLKSIVNKAPKNSGGKVQNCYDVYWVTTYDDGSQTWDYLYSYCDDACNTTRTTKVGTFRVNCETNGQDDNGCCIPDPNFQVTTAPGTEVSTVCNPDTIDPTTGKTIKNCTHTWEVVHVTSVYLTKKYYSIEEADFVMESGIWTFKTLTHSSQTESGNLLPCFSSTFTINTASPSISADRRTGSINIVYTLTKSISCIPYANPVPEIGNHVHPWQAN